MPSGGARVNSGPPPDPNALRRDRPSDKDGWTTLPAEGRRGKAPVWPLHDDIRLTAALGKLEDERLVLEDRADSASPTRAASAAAKLAELDQKIAVVQERLRVSADMETGLWKSLWKTPQAVMWAKLRWTREVALYVRWQVQAELGDLDAAKEARQWSDRLGLNPTALLRNRWRIAPSTPAKRTNKPPAGEPAGPSSAKGRLHLIDGGGAA